MKLVWMAIIYLLDCTLGASFSSLFGNLYLFPTNKGSLENL